MPLVGRGPSQCVLPTTQSAIQGSRGTDRADQGDDRIGTVVRLLYGGRMAGHEHEHGTAHLPAEGLASAQACRRLPAANRGVTIRGHGIGSALVHRFVPGLGRTRWLADVGLGHGLPHPEVAGLAAFAQWQGHDRSGRPGASPDNPLRHAEPGTHAVPAAVGQRAGLHQSRVYTAGA